MFDSHPQLAIPGESHFITRMARRRERYERPDGFDAGRFLEDLLGEEQFRRWQLPGNLVRDAIAQGEPECFADAVRAVFRVYAAHREKPLYGDKTPGFVRELPLLAELFPEARFVHLVRDGRDVVLSLREMDWAQRGGLDTLARFWQTNVDLGFTAGEQLGPRRYRELRYEELIDDPESELRGVCSFLGLAYEAAMLSYHERADELARSLRQSRDHGHLRFRPTQRLRDWRTEMSKHDLLQFELVAGDALERAGYDRAT